MPGLFDILAAGIGGVDQGLQDRRQRERQGAYDQAQRDQFQLQKDQAQFQRDQAAQANQRANAATRAQGIELARNGVFSDKNALNQYYKDAGLHVEQVSGQATMQLSPLMQMALGRKSLTSNNLTGPDGQRVMTDRDYAAGQYGVVRSNQLADTAAQRAAEAQRLAEERAFQERQAAAQRAFQEKLAKLQGSLQLQTALAQRDYTPSFSTITRQDGQVYSFNQRNGGINPLGIHAQEKTTQQSALDAEKTIADILKTEFPYGVLPSQKAEYSTRRAQLRALASNGQLPDPSSAPGSINPSTGQPYGPMAQILLQNLPGAKGAK